MAPSSGGCVNYCIKGLCLSPPCGRCSGGSDLCDDACLDTCTVGTDCTLICCHGGSSGPTCGSLYGHEGFCGTFCM